MRAIVRRMGSYTRWLAVVGAIVLCTTAPTSVAPQQPAAATPWPAPLDPQVVRDQDDMTWADYKPIPGVNWAVRHARPPSERTIKIAMVLLTSRTSRSSSRCRSTPTRSAIPRSIRSSARTCRSSTTTSGTSRSRSTTAAPCTSTGWSCRTAHRRRVHAVRSLSHSTTPHTANCGRRHAGGQQADATLWRDVDALWRPPPARTSARFDLVMRIYAGYDETTVWQEFGEMKFQTQATTSSRRSVIPIRSKPAGSIRATPTGPAGWPARICGATPASTWARARAPFVTRSRTRRSASATTTTIPT